MAAPTFNFIQKINALDASVEQMKAKQLEQDVKLNTLLTNQALLSQALQQFATTLSDTQAIAMNIQSGLEA